MRQLFKMSTLLLCYAVARKGLVLPSEELNFTSLTTSLLRTLLCGSINEVDISTPKAFILPLICILLYKQVLEQAFLDLKEKLND